MIAQAFCIHDRCDGCGADAGMRWKGYGNWKTLIFRRDELGRMGGTKSHGCGEHWRTSESAQDETLCNICMIYFNYYYCSLNGTVIIVVQVVEKKIN